jgi:hypothetical protein
MMPKERAEYRARNSQDIEDLIRQAEIGVKAFKKEGISETSVSRAKRGENVTKKVIGAIYTVLKEHTTKTFDELFIFDPKKIPDDPEYSWDQIENGAIRVAPQIFERLKPDAVLTFPGASSIFAGLVFAKAPAASVRDAFRTPIYMAPLVNKAAPVPDEFYPIVTKPVDRQKEFKILIPKALFSYRNIAVIDDTIISGVAMEALRYEFRKPEVSKPNDPIVLTFACCVWHSGLRISGRILPEIRGLDEPVGTEKFVMPWGPGFCFEDLAL